MVNYKHKKYKANKKSMIHIKSHKWQLVRSLRSWLGQQRVTLWVWLRPTSHKMLFVAATALLLFSQVIPFLQPQLEARQYSINQADGLLPKRSPILAKLVTYDVKTSQYSFNANYSLGDSSNVNAHGGAKIKATFASNASAGIKVTDPVNNTDFTLTPKFDLLQARQDSNRIYYPLKDGTGWLVYTMEASQVREDLVLSRNNGNTLNLDYDLGLSDGTQARLQKDGSVGVYGSSLPINGQVSTGSARDEKLLKAIRQNAKKDKLLFTLPAPVTNHSNLKRVQAHYVLNGNKLTLQASGLRDASYPLDIDPSVYVQSAQGLMYGNNETNISFDSSSNVLEKTQLSGGNIRDQTSQNSWNASTGLPTGIWNSGVAVAGGFIYVVGGVTGTGTVPTSAMYYAQLDATSGAIGAWKTSGGYALPTALKSISLVTYNDYLYAIGGNTGTATASSVYELHLAASGEPTPSWTATTVLPAALQYTSAIAYQNQLYVLGGQAATSGTAGSTNVYTASIKPSGELGSWSATTSLPLALYGATALNYNGYVYMVGGSSAGAPQSTIYFAQITSTGNLGIWQQGASFATGRQAFGGAIASIWAGYLYVGSGCVSIDASGNCNAAPSGTIQEASINADGSITTFTTLQYASSTNPIGFSNINQPLSGNGFLAWSGTLYNVGGCATALSGGGCPSSLNNTYYATITAEGDTGPAITTSSLNSTGGLYAMGAAINNGFIYSIGGCTTTTSACNTVSNKIYYAAINGDGSLGTWNSTTATLKTAAAALGVAIYNNVLYTLGGSTGTNLIKNGSYGAIDTTTGDIATTTAITAGANTSLTNFTEYNYMFSRSIPGSTTGAGYIYSVGGCTTTTPTTGSANTGVGCSAYTTAVLRCTVTAAAAAPTGCTTTGMLQLATGLGIFGGANYSSFIYLSGGANSAGAGQTGSIYYATYSQTGNIVRIDNGSATGGWQTTTASLAPVLSLNGDQTTTGVRRRTSAYIVNGYLYVLAGHDGTAGGAGTQLGDIQIGKIDPYTGNIASFIDNNFEISTRWDFKGVAANGFIYAIGGCSNGYPPGNCNSEDGKVQYVQVFNNYSGSPASYNSTTNSSTARIGANSAIYNGYIYNAGGCTNIGCTTFTNTVEYAPINVDGSLGAWTTATSTMGSTRTFFRLLASGGYLYAIGGRTGNATSTSLATTERAQLSGGVPGTWSATTTMNNARSNFDAVTYNGYVYVGGGINAAGTYLVAIEYAPINANGTLGTWVNNTTVFNLARSGLSLVAYNSALYIIGGYSGSVYLSDVQFAPINSNGSVGVFDNGSPSLPQPVSDASAFAANGYLYVLGGRSAATSCTNNTYVASMTANSSIALGNDPNGLGSWSQTSVLFGSAATSARYGHSASYANGKVYVVGGGCTALTNATYYGSVQSQPQTAQYSYAIDAINDVFPSKSLFNGLDNGIGASWILDYKSSTNSNNAWGQGVSYGKTTLGTPQIYNPLDAAGSNTNYARYYWIELTIDGSQAFGYPEDVTRGPTIANLTLQFTANPAQRLRHGKTFINNVQQPLDAAF